MKSLKLIQNILLLLVLAVPAWGQVSEKRLEAKKLLERMSNVKVPMDHPLLDSMEDRISKGDWLGAAAIAQEHPDFYNSTVKLMALKMSTRDESFRQALNDFSASFIGITKDQSDARELLYGNFYYRADLAKVPTNITVRSDLAKDILASNNHYADLDRFNLDIANVLMRVNGQMLISQPENNNNAAVVVPNPDPAGVLTSRAFMGSHAIAGTNRRPVEFTFREFMCVPIEEWADTMASDARIGRDIDRFPGGDHSKFLTTCKGCHTVMDGFRGAFARWNFQQNRIFQSQTVASRPNNYDNNFVHNKMNQNSSTFSGGYVTTDDSFVNNARGQANESLFGWRGQAAGGKGVAEFGKMVSNSKRFSQCMAKRVFEAVCKQELIARYNMDYLKAQAEKFESSGYNLKKLFQEVAVSKLCLGQQ